jgi:ADP-ribose pyrophosphatase YjhB (NUDIX family)
VERKNEPFKGQNVLPGGFVAVSETVEAAALRELKEETGVIAKLVSILGVYSDPKRDPRGHVISTVFVAEYVSGDAKGSDDSARAGWHAIDRVKSCKLGFDHSKIFSDYMKWRASRGTFWSTEKE